MFAVKTEICDFCVIRGDLGGGGAWHSIDDVTHKLICIFSIKLQIRSNKQLSRILSTII